MLPATVLALAITTLPPTAKPGDVEKMIDALAEIDGFRDLHDDSDPRLDAIIRLGFDAVHALIEHLNDTQVTKCRLQPMDNFRGYTYCVGDFARDILNGYIVESGGWFERLRGDESTKKDAGRWWAAAKKLGEEKYLLQNLTEWRDDGRGIRAQPLRVLVVKYPEKLPDAFAAALTAGKGELHYSPLVQAVVESKLTAVTKRRLLLDLYAVKSCEGKASALDGLHSLDADEFHKRLIETLNELPKHPKGPDGEQWPFRGFTSFADTASLTPDPKVWSAVSNYLGRASVEVRIEWIDFLAWRANLKGDNSKIAVRQIDCLAALLVDDTAHKRKYGVGVETTEVRNHVAKRLAEALSLKTEPAETWTADDWKKFREEAAKAARDATKKGG
jgi:hypothetical protein